MGSGTGCRAVGARRSPLAFVIAVVLDRLRGRQGLFRRRSVRQ